MSKEYDLVILGGGIAGYMAAIKASQENMSVALVEEREVGGTCLHRGCIPSKTFLHAASVFRQTKEAATFGVQVDQVNFDYKIALERKNTIVNQLYSGVKALLSKANVDVIEGRGRILGPSIFSPLPGTISIEHKEEMENTMLVPKYILLATGSKPKHLNDFPIDGKYIIDSDQMVNLEELPNSIAIIGGGVIGMEWASFLQDVGVKVSVIEAQDDILLSEDRDVRSYVKQSLQNRGVRFYTNNHINDVSVQEEKQQVEITINKDEQIVVEQVFVAIGRDANITDIGLENTNIKLNNQLIQVNDHYQTEETHIYAVGDCIGGYQLAHVAATEGMRAVEHMINKEPVTIENQHIPKCVYSYPEIGSIGLTEEEAKNKGFSIKVGSFPFQANGKALLEGEEGFIKYIANKDTDDILGIHIVGAGATNMISEAALASFLDASTFELQQVIRPHPSLSEVYTEVSLAADKKAIHI